ncbi:MAG: alkaline phosphatase family protein [Pseudomonadales bacterium]|nr:alkaline phosphatase family protein [Pseudomonadales bacterium]MCP5184961.1 alkaline phosphatase family protein [Pseudomonadales bacterium]
MQVKVADSSLPVPVTVGCPWEARRVLGKPGGVVRLRAFAVGRSPVVLCRTPRLPAFLRWPVKAWSGTSPRLGGMLAARAGCHSPCAEGASSDVPQRLSNGCQRPRWWRLLLAYLLTTLALPGWTGTCQTENLLLVTLDGLRWQEVFSGIDGAIFRDAGVIRHHGLFAGFEATYWRHTREARREALMPFLWSVVASRGQLLGDRTLGNLVQVANPYHFSYPGYSEILTGIVDPAINSNDKVPNPNRSFLEWLNAMPAFAGRVAAFASWEVFPAILNVPRSGLPVNAGFAPLVLPGNPAVTLLNALQTEVPSPWDTVRLDAFTQRFAAAYLAAARPRVLYVALGETDDFAHDGAYDLYARAATRNDTMLRALWEQVQADTSYRDRTTLIVTTDHGRGRTPADWTSHGVGGAAAPDGYAGDEETWLAVLGPDTPARGVLTGGDTVVAGSVAASALALLGIDRAAMDPEGRMAPPIDGIVDCTRAR